MPDTRFERTCVLTISSHVEVEKGVMHSIPAKRLWAALSAAAMATLCPLGRADDCLTVAGARELAIGTPVRLCNVTITSIADLIEAPNRRDFYIQDNTGGAHIFGNNQAIAELLSHTGLAHAVELSGVTASYAGMFELVGPFTLVDFGTAGLPAAAHTIGGDWLDESPSAELFEGELSWIARVQFLESGVFEGVRTYLASDDGGLTIFKVRVATSQHPLVGTPIPTGLISLRGMFSQFDLTEPFTAGYELLLRDRSDVWPYLVGDVTMDCVVDISDLSQLLANFGAIENVGPIDGDLNLNGTVDINDLALLLGGFGTSCN